MRLWVRVRAQVRAGGVPTRGWSGAETRVALGPCHRALNQ